MMVRRLAALLITAIPSVVGLHEMRQLDSDDAEIIAEYYAKGLDSLPNRIFDIYIEFFYAAEMLLELLEEEEGLPPFSSEEMLALTMEVFIEDGSTDDAAFFVPDFPETFLNATKFLSGSSPIMAEIYQILPELILDGNAYTRQEFVSRLNDVAQNSGQESELVLASIAADVGEAANEYWNGVNFTESRRLSPFSTNIIPDVIGVLIGYERRGLISAILFGILSSAPFYQLSRHNGLC